MADNPLAAVLLKDQDIEMSDLKKSSSELLFNLKSEKVKPSSIKEDMNKVTKYLADLAPVMIDTPFQGSSLVMTKDEKKYVFGSRESRIAVVDRETKQVTLDVDLDQGSIWTMTLIENDKYVLSAGAKGTIKKLLFSDLSVVDEFLGHTDEINFIQVSKSEEFMYTCSDDTTVRKWLLRAPASESRDEVIFEHSSTIYCIDLSLDEKYLASCSADCSVKVYSFEQKEVIGVMTDSNSPQWACKISGKNRWVVAGNQEGQLFMWKFGSWELERILTGHSDRIRYLDMAKDESFIVTAGIDTDIKVWDTVGFRKEITMKGHRDWVKFTLISQDQSTIFSCADDRKVCAWKVPNFTDQISMAHPEDNFQTLDSSHKLAYSKCDNKIVGYDFLGHKMQEFNLEGYEVVHYEFDHSGEILYVFAIYEEKNYFLTWNLATGTKIKEHEISTEHLYSGIVFPDGKHIAVGEQVRVNILNIENLKPEHTFRSHRGKVEKLAVNSNGRKLFSSDNYGMIKVYSHGDKWEEVDHINEKSQLVILQISKDDEYLFTSTGYELKVWGLKRLGLMNTIPNFTSTKLIFTNDFDYFVHCTNEKVFFRDLDNFGVVFSIQNNEQIVDFTLSPDESLISVTSGNNTTFLSNPLKCNNFSIVGSTEGLYKFVEYINKVMTSDHDYESEFDTWIIEPYHINTVHIYSFFNKTKILEKSIINFAPFFPSRLGHTPMSIAIEKKFMDSIDCIYRALKHRLENGGDTWAFYHLGDSLVGLNRLGYSNLHRIYELGLSKCTDPTLVKFAHESTPLPRVVFSDHPITDESDFAKVAFVEEGMAIAFGQSEFRLSLVPGSSDSLEFLESVLECQNDQIYYTKLIQIILDTKWKQVRWFIGTQALIYIAYLICLAIYSLIYWKIGLFLILPFILSSILFVYEGFQMYNSGLDYFTDAWNYIDLVRGVLFNAYCIIEWGSLIQNQELLTDIFVFTVMFSWIRGITYFKMFERTRYLINLIMEASVDIVAFFVLLFYTTIAFALVMQSLYFNRDPNDNDPQSLLEFFLASYKQNLGEFPEDPVSMLTYVLFFIITIVNPVIMLNLLISIMGDTYGRVKEGKTIADARELAGMILEIESLMSRNREKNEKLFLKIVCEESFLKLDEEGVDAKIRLLNDKIELLGENISSAKATIFQSLESTVADILQAIRDKNNQE